MCAVYFDRTSSRADLVPTKHVMALYRPRGLRNEMWDRLLPPVRHDEWDITNPDAGVSLLREMDRKIGPALRALETVEGVDERNEVAYAGGLTFYWFRAATYRVFNRAAMGEFDEAREACEKMLELKVEGVLEKDVTFLKQVLSPMAPLLRARDRAGIAALLHQNEREAVEMLKLAPYWQPSPFPLELAEG